MSIKEGWRNSFVLAVFYLDLIVVLDYLVGRKDKRYSYLEGRELFVFIFFSIFFLSGIEK